MRGSGFDSALLANVKSHGLSELISSRSIDQLLQTFHFAFHREFAFDPLASPSHAGRPVRIVIHRVLDRIGQRIRVPRRHQPAQSPAVQHFQRTARAVGRQHGDTASHAFQESKRQSFIN